MSKMRWSRPKYAVDPLSAFPKKWRDHIAFFGDFRQMSALSSMQVRAAENGTTHERADTNGTNLAQQVQFMFCKEREMRKRELPRHEIPKPLHVLRASDIREMIKDGSIERQHFLIRLLAESIEEEDNAR